MKDLSMLFARISPHTKKKSRNCSIIISFCLKPTEEKSSKRVRATAEEGDRKIGVIWHTQGSGKSLSMVFFTAKIIKHPALENPIVLVLTDRNDLDNQIYDETIQRRR
jgi:type I site-specific restriction-modification system R (restriction) subunit